MLPIAPAHFRAGTSYGSGYDEHAGRSARRRVASDLAATLDLTVLSEWPMPALSVDCFLMRSSPGRPVGEILQALAHDSRVTWAQELHSYHALGRGDPLYQLQPGGPAWHLAELHGIATGHNVAIAVVDSGIELSHPDLRGRIATSQNFVDSSVYTGETHGTAVAGIIAANADDGIGIAGIAPEARLMALRACWETAGGATSCNSFTLAKALQFAVSNDAQVINMSLTGPQDRLLGLLLETALSHGVAVVGAVDPAVADGGFPASHSGVVAVAGDDSPGVVGTVRAPGLDVPATLPGAQWGFVSGSSFAAAHITGVLALLQELHPAITPDQARQLLLAAGTAPHADSVADLGSRDTTDVCALITHLAKACACACMGRSETPAITRR
jgi:hypothetical protein